MFGDIGARFPLRTKVKAVTTAVRLCLFLLVFIEFPAAKKETRTSRANSLQLASTSWNDAAHLVSRPASAVPICLNRHNSATGNSPDLGRGGGHRRCSRRFESAKTSGIGRQSIPRCGRIAAEELGNRWRFFATYTPVQTSPVFRHPFLARVIANVRSDACRPALR